MAAAVAPSSASAQQTILNVSYDPTRELYQDYNAAFAAYWKAKTGQTVIVNQSHGGSGKQARAVIDGLEADVVTLGLAYDIDALHDKADLLPANWQTRLPYNSTPLHFGDRLPRAQGQPQGDQGLARPDQARHRGGGSQPQDFRRRALGLPVGVGIRDCKAGGAARPRPRTSSAKLYKNVPVLDSGARGATTTFVERGIGDVLLDLGERGLPGAEGEWQRTSSTSSTPR